MVSLIEAMAILALFGLMTLWGLPALRRRFLRNHVWLTIDTKAGQKTERMHAKPRPDNTVQTKWGPYLITEDGFTRINPGIMAPKNVPLYRYVEGMRVPINLSKIVSSNPGIEVLAKNLDRALRDTKVLERNNWIRMIFHKTDIILIALVAIVSGVMGGLIAYGFAR